MHFHYVLILHEMPSKLAKTAVFSIPNLSESPYSHTALPFFHTIWL